VYRVTEGGTVILDVQVDLETTATAAAMDSPDFPDDLDLRYTPDSFLVHRGIM